MTMKIRRRRLPKMKPVKRTRSFKAHHHLIGLFTGAAILLIMLNIAVILMPSDEVQATVTDNVTGWAWSSTGGWLSMNDTNAGAGGGTYGVNIDVATKAITGFAWSSNIGWVCFGSTCDVHPSCSGGTIVTPEGVAPYASVDGSNQMRGWAMICSLGSSGWISLNCANTAACATSNYQVNVDFPNGTMSGFGWNALSGPAGWGWVNFDLVTIDQTNLEDKDTLPIGSLCVDGIDNDFDGLIDCEETGCRGEVPYCPMNETDPSCVGIVACGTPPICANGIDDDGDGLDDCADPDCASYFTCVPENLAVVGPGVNACTDGVDNDADGILDCSDSNCVGVQGCEICDNTIDDDSDTDIDCDDNDCHTAAVCTPAWLKTEYGNIYAELGVQHIDAPQVTEANASYCITSAGSITNFRSGIGCEEASAGVSYDLPIGPSGYATTLGRLDVDGILNGRYGAVVNLSNPANLNLPTNLDGRVFVYDSATDAHLSAKTLLNATGMSKGSGLLVIKGGANLFIDGNIDYQAGSGVSRLRNLASFGILVLGKYSGSTYQSGGNIYINPNVTKLVGTIYAERSIHTGSKLVDPKNTDLQLQVYGAFVSREIVLERQKATPTESAELIRFDGRAIVNPPPGFQDVAKSLPSISDQSY